MQHGALRWLQPCGHQDRCMLFLGAVCKCKYYKIRHKIVRGTYMVERTGILRKIERGQAISWRRGDIHARESLFSHLFFHCLIGAVRWFRRARVQLNPIVGCTICRAPPRWTTKMRYGGASSRVPYLYHHLSGWRQSLNSCSRIATLLQPLRHGSWRPRGWCGRIRLPVNGSLLWLRAWAEIRWLQVRTALATHFFPFKTLRGA